MHQALEALFINMAANLRNPAVAAFSPVPLQQSYNGCVPAPAPFPPGSAECSMEFLRGLVPPGRDGLLGHLHAAPGFFTTYTEQGVCGLCQQQSQQVSLTAVTLSITNHFPALPEPGGAPADARRHRLAGRSAS